MTEIRRRQVSVIIPCYRQAQYLPASIDCVLAQTYDSVELIIVNDGSDDDTEQVVRRYGTRVTYVHKANGGMSSARNAGIGLARGQYLLFLDADDLLHPEAVERLVAAAGGSGDRMAMMGVRCFAAEDDHTSGPVMIPAFHGRLAPEIFVHNHPVHGILCPKAAIVAAGGFDESLRAVEDWDLWIRVALRGIDVVSIPWCGAFYRQVPGSMSSDRSRMARGKCRMFGKAWAAVRDRDDFWAAWAGAFLRSLYAVRRNCKVLGLESEISAIQEIIDEIRGRGVRVCSASPAALRLQDAVPATVGDCLEAAGLNLARLWWPSFYDRCKN